MKNNPVLKKKSYIGGNRGRFDKARNVFGEQVSFSLARYATARSLLSSLILRDFLHLNSVGNEQLCGNILQVKEKLEENVSCSSALSCSMELYLFFDLLLISNRKSKYLWRRKLK